jgi:SsrA-binding protein
VYDKRGYLKVEVALARGKKQWDKRESIAKREAAREIDRTVKELSRA